MIKNKQNQVCDVFISEIKNARLFRGSFFGVYYSVLAERKVEI